jgi:hypothetical protein
VQIDRIREPLEHSLFSPAAILLRPHPEGGRQRRHLGHAQRQVVDHDDAAEAKEVEQQCNKSMLISAHTKRITKLKVYKLKKQKKTLMAVTSIVIGTILL